jgi:hypothetical protein
VKRVPLLVLIALIIGAIVSVTVAAQSFTGRPGSSSNPPAYTSGY